MIWIIIKYKELAFVLLITYIWNTYVILIVILSPLGYIAFVFFLNCSLSLTQMLQLHKKLHPLLLFMSYLRDWILNTNV